MVLVRAYGGFSPDCVCPIFVCAPSGQKNVGGIMNSQSGQSSRCNQSSLAELPEQGSRSSQSNQQVAEDEGVESWDASLLRASQEAALEHLDLASKHLADVSHMTDGEVPLVIVNKLVSWTECLLAVCPQLNAGS